MLALVLAFFSQFTLQSLAEPPRVPVTGWKSSFSYSSWLRCGAGSVAGETDLEAAQDMLNKIQAETGCRPTFNGFNTAPAAAAMAGWPSPENRISMNLCHGWTSNPQIFPELYPGTQQERINKTCALVTFPPNCRPCEGYTDYGMNFVRNTAPICPEGYAYSGGGFCSCQAIAGSYAHCKNNEEADSGPMCEDSSSVDDESNPFNIGTGSKYTFETDYVGTGSFPLIVRRHYDSRTKRNGMFGPWWGVNFDLALKGVSPGFLAVSKVKRPSGRATYASTKVSLGAPTVSYPDRSSVDDFWEAKDANGIRVGWVYRDTHRQETEFYGLDGKIASITNEVGQKHTYIHDSLGRLSSVTDAEGRSLVFRYDNANRVVEIATPRSVYDSVTGTYSRSIQYAYNSLGLVTAVKRANGGIKTYLYENPNMPHALTGIIDERGKRTRIWDYDSITGLVTSGGYGGGPGSSVVGGVSLSRTPGSGLVMATKGGGNGGVRSTIYKYDTKGESTRLTEVSGDDCANCSKVGRGGVKTYGSNSMPSERTYRNGRRDTYTYTASRLQKSRTIAAGTTQQTTRSIDWNEAAKKPKFTEDEFLRIEFTYNAYGAIETKKEIDKTPGGATRLHRYDYVLVNGAPRVKFYTNPRGFRTIYDYKPNGDLKTITNALGHVFTIEKNSIGDVAWIQDPNGLTRTLTYDADGRITSNSQGGRVTAISYDSSGRITKFTAPEKTSFTFAYDDIGRLTRITSNFGDYQTIQYDSAGNRTGVSLWGSGNQLVNSMNAQFNAFGQLEKTLSAGSIAQDTLNYDLNGNIREIRNALGFTSTHNFDVLDRVTEKVLPNGGRVSMEYDKAGRITKIIDPNYATTTYEYDGFGNILRVRSADAGTRTYSYDTNGNILSITDGAGKVTLHQYDALDRAIRTTPVDPKLATQLIYDEGTNGKGRLTTVRDINGYKAFFYNLFGEVIAISQTVANVEYRTFYNYDALGRLISIRYPSGRLLNYIYGAETDRILGVTMTHAGVTTSLATNIAYAPFSVRSGFTYGNGKLLSTTFNQDLLPITRATAGLESKSFTYDAGLQLKQISDTLNATNNESFTFAELGELKQAVGSYGTKSYTFDKNQNNLGVGTFTLPTDAVVLDSTSRVFDLYTTYYPTDFYGFSGSTITQTGAKGWRSLRTKKGVVSGKWYWELKIVKMGSVPGAGNSVVMAGLGTATAPMTSHLASSTSTLNQGWGVTANGDKFNLNIYTSNGEALWADGDVLGFTLDADAKVLRAYRNGQPMNGTDGIVYSGFSSISGFYPMVSTIYPGTILEANFGNRAFTYTAPAGFVAFDPTAANFFQENFRQGEGTYNPTVNSSSIYDFNLASLTRRATSNSWQSVRAKTGFTSGKKYWEVKVTKLNSTPSSSSSVLLLGVGTGTAPIAGHLASSTTAANKGWALSANGMRYTNNAGTAFNTRIFDGDVIGFALDLDSASKNLKVYRNGLPFNGTDGLLYADLLSTSGFYAMASTFYPGTSIDVNFGRSAFTYAPPAGYVAYDTSAYNFFNEDLVPDTEVYDPKINNSISGLNVTKLKTFDDAVRATRGVSAGRWYWEVEYTEGVPETPDNVNDNLMAVGVIMDRGYLNMRIGQNRFGFAYSMKKTKGNNNSFPAWGQNTSPGDVISVLFDADLGELFFYKNGVPMTSDGKAFTAMPKGLYFPVIQLATAGDKAEVNFGQKPFKFAPRDTSFKPYDATGTQGVYPFTNRLRAGVYTANGNLSRYGNFTLVYDDFDRVSQVLNATAVVARYLYNSEGLRVVKQSGGYTTGYVYDEHGQMLGEYDGAGRMLKEYFYLRGERIAMAIPNAASNQIVNSVALPDATRAVTLSSLLTLPSLFEATLSFMSSNIRAPEREGIYFYHNDIKKTPRWITDMSGATVWQASYDPLGRATTQTAVVSNNHRFPGQYFDQETGLHQNGQRDYDPSLGRYLQFDPVGIEAGLNPYVYASGDPINAVDPSGTVELEEYFAHRPELLRFFEKNMFGNWTQVPVSKIQSGVSFPVILDNKTGLVGLKGSGSGIHVTLKALARLARTDAAGAVRLTKDASTGKWLADISGFSAKTPSYEDAMQIAEVFRAVGIEIVSLTPGRLGTFIPPIHPAAGFATLEFLAFIDGVVMAYMAGKWVGDRIYENYCTDIADMVDDFFNVNQYDPNAQPSLQDRVRMDKANWFRPRPRPMTNFNTVRG